MFRKAPLGGIENDIHLMHAALPGVSRLRTKLLQGAPKGFHILDLQLDFSFARHALPFAPAGYFRPQRPSVSITNVYESILMGAAHAPCTKQGSVWRPLAKKRLVNPESEKISPPVSEVYSPTSSLAPPVARREPVEHVVHGDRRVDHYDWLRHKKSSEVLAYLEAENAYTDGVLKPTQDFQEKLYAEMLERILQTDLSVPYRLRGYLYFTKTVEGKQYPYHYRRRDEEGSAEELLLDLNELAQGHSFLGLDSFEVSDDNHWLAYSTDIT